MFWEQKVRFRKATNNNLMVYFVIELFVIANAWVLSYFLRFCSFFTTPKGIPDYYICLKLIPFLWFSWAIVKFFYGQKSEKKYLNQSLSTSFHQVIIFFLVFVGVTYFYREYKYSRLAMLFFMVIFPMGWLSVKLLLKFLENRVYRKQYRKIVIVSTSTNISKTIQYIRDSEDITSCAVTALLLEEKKDNIQNKYLDKIVFCSGDLLTVLMNYDCDCVFIALEHCVYSRFQKDLTKVVSQIGEVKIIPDLAIYTYLTSSIEIVNHQIVVNVNDTPLQGWGAFVKRVVDVVGGFVGLLLFAPFFVIISIFIKIINGGPILFRQRRMGLDGREFVIYKFCTMTPNLEKDSDKIWTKSNDIRVNFLGRLLRRTSLDETPQFLNIVKGDMSLVGPRPERAYFVDQFRKTIPGYMLRHKVRSGLTGWAQVHGFRGDTSIEKRIEMDLAYIQNWSVWLDIKIIFMTLFKGFKDPNAY
jgi:Undecaprenyl-phosphate glucose phosphotransferase